MLVPLPISIELDQIYLQELVERQNSSQEQCVHLQFQLFRRIA